VAVNYAERNREAADKRFAAIINDAFKPLLDELKRKPVYWAVDFAKDEPMAINAGNLRFSPKAEDFSRNGPPKDFGFKSSDPDELGVKPVEGHVTGEQLQNIMDQTWRALGVSRYKVRLGWPDPDKHYLVTDVTFSATEEGQC
jgi:hypothetical protein